MKNYKLASLFNALLLFFLIFVIAYLLLSFLTKIKILKVLTSCMFALSFTALFFIRDYKNNKRAFLKNHEQKQFEKFMQKLEIMPDNDVIALLLQLFSKAEITAKANKNTIETKNAKCFFDFSKTTQRVAVCNALKVSQNKNVIFFCNKISEECLDIVNQNANRFALIEGNTFFALLKKHDLFEMDLPEKRDFLTFFKKLWNLIKKSFTKKKSFSFTMIGISLLVLSTLTFFKKYYLICALVCFLYALACLIFGKKEQKRANESLPFDL